MANEKPWPFPIKPEAEWTRFDRDFIEFMRAADAAGFRPRTTEAESYVAAESHGGRFIAMIFRGMSNGWEVCPRDLARDVPLGPSYGLPDYACICVRPPFSAAAHFALEWLRGRDLPSLLSEFDFVGKSPPGIVLRPPPAAPPSEGQSEPGGA